MRWREGEVFSLWEVLDKSDFPLVESELIWRREEDPLKRFGAPHPPKKSLVCSKEGKEMFSWKVLGGAGGRAVGFWWLCCGDWLVG